MPFFACLDCPSRLLASSWPHYWFCRHLVTQGRLLDLQILLSASLVFESCATPLGGKVSLKLWKTLFFMPLDRKPIDLCWKVTRGVSLLIVSVVTLVRLWSICSSTVPWPSGLGWIQSLLFLLSPLVPAITVRHVLFGISSDELLCVSRVFCYLLSLLKFFVWCQRNEYRFRSKPTSAVGLIASIKVRLSLYLPLLFKCFRSRRRRRFFQCHWGANGLIGKVVGDSFHFCLS